MGEVKVLFCELCKAEIAPATFSSPNESGEIRYYLRLHKLTGSNVEIDNYEVCETCYGKVKTWASNKAKLAATAWKTEPPAATTVNMPTI